MKTTTIVLIAILAVVLANDVYEEFKQVLSHYQQLQQIDATEFGRTMFDALQMDMQSGEPIEKFADKMHEVEGMLEREQKEADAKNRQEQDGCDRDLGDLNNDNNLLLRRRVESQSKLDELNPQVVRRNTQIGAKNKWKEGLEAKIAELVKVRAGEAAEFKQKNDEHDYAAFVIQTVRNLFTNGNGSPSFLQAPTQEEITTEQLKTITDHLLDASEQAKQFKIKKSYSQVFKVLAQITMNMDQVRDSPTVQRILSLCDQLLHNIDVSRDLESKAEQKRINSFNQEKELLDKDLAKFNNQIARLTAEIQQLQDQINAAENDLTDTNERQSQKQKQIDDRSKECNEASFGYEQARNKRQENRRIVSDIIGIVHANQRDFAAYVKARSDAGDFDGQNFNILNPVE